MLSWHKVGQLVTPIYREWWRIDDVPLPPALVPVHGSVYAVAGVFVEDYEVVFQLDGLGSDPDVVYLAAGFRPCRPTDILGLLALARVATAPTRGGRAVVR